MNLKALGREAGRRLIGMIGGERVPRRRCACPAPWSCANRPAPERRHRRQERAVMRQLHPGRLHRRQARRRLLARAARDRADPHHPEPARASSSKHGILESLTLPNPPPPLRIPRNQPRLHRAGLLGFRRRQMDRGGELCAVATAATPTSRPRSTTIVDELAAGPAARRLPQLLVHRPRAREPLDQPARQSRALQLGHLLEGAIAYFQATGRRKLLDIMERYVDHIRADLRHRTRARSAAIAATRRSSWR